MNIRLQLHRPRDRYPDDHLYGEPFDTELNKLVGGESRWSSPREDRAQQPTVHVLEQNVLIRLHEDGPFIEFVLQNIDQIPNYISAMAAVISAWSATRELRKRELPKDDFRRESGTVIEVGDLRLESRRDLQPAEVIEIMTSLASFHLKNSGAPVQEGSP